MTMNMDRLLAVETGALTPDMLLGMQVLFTIPDRGVPFERLRNAWCIEGLDETLIPDRRTPVNQAEAACKSVETRKGSTPEGDRLIVTVDRISRSGEACEYQLTRKVLDKANHVIEHEKGMTLTFHAKAHALGLDPWEVRPFAPEHYLPMRSLEAAIRDHFDLHEGTVPGQKVRNAVRDYLVRKDKMGGTNMRRASGGVYFVPIEHAPTLDAIARVIKGDPSIGTNGLYGDDADFDLIPMANSVGVRETVAKHHMLNVRDDAADLAREISQRLKETGTPRRDFMDRIKREVSELAEHRARMAQMLNHEREGVDFAMQGLQAQLDRLLAVAPA